MYSGQSRERLTLGLDLVKEQHFAMWTSRERVYSLGDFQGAVCTRV